MYKRMTRMDILSEIILYLLLLLIIGLIAYPIFFIVIASLSEPTLVLNGRVWLYPRQINLVAYTKVLGDSALWRSYLNTIAYAGVGTVLSLVFTLPAAYALSRKDCPFRWPCMFFFVATLYFSGGLVPTYLTIKQLGLINTFWVMVLPFSVNVYHLILARTFFASTLPEDLLGAARIDGCGSFSFFIRIALPLSKAIIAVLSLYCIVSKWNGYFDALVYLNDSKRYPLQMILRSILIENTLSESTTDLGDYQRANLVEALKYSVIVVASMPIMIVYPFLQKYFTKGVMLGSIKA